PQAFYYGFRHFERTDLRNPVALACLALLTVLLMVALVMLFLRSVAGFGLLLMLSSLAVVSNLFEPVAGMAGDRLTYVASFGFCMAVAYGLTLLYQRLTAPVPVKVFSLAVGALLVVWSGMTMARSAKWKDALT